VGAGWGRGGGLRKAAGGAIIDVDVWPTEVNMRPRAGKYAGIGSCPVPVPFSRPFFSSFEELTHVAGEWAEIF